jgi:hypothetical protein
VNKIDSYRFGQIVINGQKYTSDVIIFPDRVQDDWWRDDSHRLTIRDITGIMKENPEVLLVGTGASGLMRVLPEVKQAVEARHIELMAQPTGEVCETYNRLSQTQRVVAALHLTC